MSFLVDTGVLLRAFDVNSTDHEDVLHSMRILRDRGESFAVTVQNLAEYWNVSTRPTANNGYGLPVPTVLRRVLVIERFCDLHTENLLSAEKWKQLLVDHHLTGVSVHDARLLSVMLTMNISNILTLNVRDFARYSQIRALTPQEFLSSAKLTEE